MIALFVSCHEVVSSCYYADAAMIGGKYATVLDIIQYDDVGHLDCTKSFLSLSSVGTDIFIVYR